MAEQSAEQDAIMAVLDTHRWKSMGVSSVECECGEILYGQDGEPLTQFPADERFRRHIAAEIQRVLLPAGDTPIGDDDPQTRQHYATCDMPHCVEQRERLGISTMPEQPESAP